jgi:serine/threonine protein kinase
MQPSISIGTVLQNRYRILNTLGQGGFGRTYLAEDQGRFNELCALKELIPPQTGDYALQKSKELFQREAQVLYQIQHPQIPQFRATFEQDQRFFLVQDYVEGKTYRRLLDDRKNQGFVFSEAEMIQLLQQVLPVLGYLHGKSIIHRDIAPDNIILRDRDQLPVLIDFGVVKELATRIQTPDTVKQQSTTVGKMGYAPIEQMQTGNAYPNSDLYALAVTTVVLLTGREPQELFDDNSMMWHWQRWCVVSPGFAQVINRMLSYTPSQRYQSATDVAQALQILSSGAAATIAPATSPTLAPNAPPTQPPVTAAPPPSQMATVTVSRSEEERPERLSRSQASIPEQRSSLWDDPWAVGLIAIGLMGLAGIGSWALFRSIMAPKPDPTPTVSISPSPTVSATPSPSPTPSPTPSPSPTMVPFSQDLDLTVAKPLSRSGTLQSNQVLTFNIKGTQGQKLTAALGGEGILMSVLSPTGEPVADQAKRVTFWEGTLPFTGNYGIELRTIKGLPKADFKLDLKLQDPPPEPSPSPTVSPTVTPSPDDPSPDPTVKTERVQFPAGQTMTQVQGSTDGQVIRRYLVSAQANQSMRLALKGDGAFTVRYQNGNPIGDASDRQAWNARLSEAGDYQVDVVLPKGGDFTLEVEVTN